jgi:murein DD-endopeptidase MepM/ murein hydrolase activator NlpD
LHYSNIKEKEIVAYNDYLIIKNKINIYDEHIKSISISIIGLNKKIKILHSIADGKNLSYIHHYYLDILEVNNNTTMSNVFSDSIYFYKKLQKEMLLFSNRLQIEKDFIEKSNDIILATPFDNPLHERGAVTSVFGWRDPVRGYGKEKDFHTGLDIGAYQGTPIYACAPGRVTAAGETEGHLGIRIKITHKYGFSTVYGHCSSIIVGYGQWVRKGQIIGYVGSTGNSTGSHCHYEVHIGGVPINPYTYMRKDW